MRGGYHFSLCVNECLLVSKVSTRRRLLAKYRRYTNQVQSSWRCRFVARLYSIGPFLGGWLAIRKLRVFLAVVSELPVIRPESMPSAEITSYKPTNQDLATRSDDKFRVR